jgi:enoyl-CoA hydratase/carnithine racemase
MDLETVVYEKNDNIVFVTLNRPHKLNAYNVQMRDDLYEAFTAVRDDPDVRVMIISGAGRAFCAGADLTEFGTAPSPVIARDVRWQRDLWGVLKDLDKVTIAAVHGHVFGSGLELALFCDLRLAAEGTIFGLPETSWGFIPGAGATQALPRITRPGSAMAAILTGERIDALEAYRIGLVHRVRAESELMTEAELLARRVLICPPQAILLAKEAVNKGMDMSLEAGLRLEERLYEYSYATWGAWNGLRAAAKSVNDQ